MAGRPSNCEDCCRGMRGTRNTSPTSKSVVRLAFSAGSSSRGERLRPREPREARSDPADADVASGDVGFTSVLVCCNAAAVKSESDDAGSRVIGELEARRACITAREVEALVDDFDALHAPGRGAARVAGRVPLVAGVGDGGAPDGDAGEEEPEAHLGGCVFSRPGERAGEVWATPPGGRAERVFVDRFLASVAVSGIVVKGA